MFILAMDREILLKDSSFAIAGYAPGVGLLFFESTNFNTTIKMINYETEFIHCFINLLIFR